MSQENVEKIRGLFEPWSGKNLHAWGDAWGSGEVDLSLLDPEVEYEDTILPDHVGETYRGVEGVARAMKRWVEPFQALTIELERVVGEGERVVSIHRVQGRAEHTGIEFESTVAYTWEFTNGHVTLFRSYWDAQEA